MGIPGNPEKSFSYLSCMSKSGGLAVLAAFRKSLPHLFCLAFLLLLGACSGGGGSSSDRSAPDLSDSFVYMLDSPYAPVLKNCATATDEADLCSMDVLPLIGQDTSTPTVADVMDRVVVSHAWMGARFEQVLKQLPPDILTLFKGVTGIVIDSDIRPSSYRWGPAVIYLDPANLWLTNDEKATISRASDYRSDYGADLQFISLWRYVLNNDYAYDYYPLNGTETRQSGDVLYPMAAILYHELGHANDFLPPTLQSSLDRHLTPYRAILSLLDVNVAAHLYATYPLQSQIWGDLGQVLYFGIPPTEEQQSYSAAYVGNQFGSDVASDPYGYSTIHEDLAMLFEETMMKYHYDIDRDVAFTDRPASGTPTCDDYLVQWGTRNRIGKTTVKSRAQLVAGELLPEADLTAFFASLPAPTAMTTGRGWCSNLSLGAVPAGGRPGQNIPPEQIWQDMRVPGEETGPAPSFNP